MKFGSLVVLSLFLNAAVIHAASFSVQTVQYPTDPTFTQLPGINNSGKDRGFPWRHNRFRIHVDPAEYIHHGKLSGRHTNHGHRH